MRAGERMTTEHRQLMNVRTIRVTLVSALRHLPPDKADLCIARARQLLDHAREEATAASVLADIEALAAELRAGDGAAQQRDS